MLHPKEGRISPGQHHAEITKYEGLCYFYCIRTTHAGTQVEWVVFKYKLYSEFWSLETRVRYLIAGFVLFLRM